jgi:cytochrome b6-f complex iron-sulfur subunit
MADDRERRELEASERFEAYLEALLGGDRPSSEQVADADEAEMARLSAELAAAATAREAGADPDPAFVEQLRIRMRAADQGIAAVSQPPPVRDVAPGGTRTTRLTRRSVLQAGLGAAAGLAAGVAGGFVLRDALDDEAPAWPGADLVGGVGTWVEVARIEQLPDGAVIPFTTQAFSGFVVNDGGEIRALSSACTHLGCTLQYRPDFRDLRCPCHAASFTLTGWLANSRRHWREDGPYPGDAEAYPIDLPPLSRPKVKVDGDLVYVWTVRSA